MKRRIIGRQLPRRTFMQGMLATLILGFNGKSQGADIRRAIVDLVNQNKKTQVLTVALPNGSESNLEAVGREFFKDTGIKIEIIKKPVDAINSYLILSALSGEYAGDVALPATFGIPDLVSSNAILDLSEYRDTYQLKSVEKGMLYMEGDSFNDKFYGYQTDGDAYLLYYNNAFFKGDLADAYTQKFGAPLTIPSTWQKLDEQIEHFHQPKKDIYGGMLFRNSNYLIWEWWLRFHAKGGMPLDAKANPLIAAEEGVQALEEMVSVSKYLPQSVFSNGLFENWKHYSKGNAYCNIGWGGTQKYLRTHDEFLQDGVTVSCPLGDEGNADVHPVGYFNWGWNYTVPVSSKDPLLSFLFSTYAVLADVSTLAVRENGFFDPFREEHYRDEQIQNLYGTQFLSVHKECMANAMPDFYISRQGEYLDSLRSGINDVLQGKQGAAASLKAVARRWQLLNRRNGPENIQRQWASVSSKYPKYNKL